MTPTEHPLRIVWFGSYAKGPGYPRSETLIGGLRELGHEVLEIHAPLFSGAGERVAAGGGGGLSSAAWRQARAAVSLARRWFAAGDHHLVVAGAGGVIDAPLLRFLQNLERRPLVLDSFVPLYDTVVRDRGLAAPDSVRAKALLSVERLAARVADLILSDTGANAELLAEDLGVGRDKIAPVAVCQPDPGPSVALPNTAELRVLLVATYIPLHGVDVVVEAARRLQGSGVAITIVGKGQTFDEVAPRAAGIDGLELVPDFEAPARIAERLAASHVGLGVFGATAKAARVVPLKAALTLAHGRALVTRGSPATRAAFDRDGRTPGVILVPENDPVALAEALAGLQRDTARREQLAVEARAVYEECFAPRAVARSFLDALAQRGLLPSDAPAR